MNELQIKDAVKIRQGIVEFPTKDEFIANARMVAETIRDTEVTEETVKANKKMLAASAKVRKAIDEKRIEVKKAMLEPYLAFEEDCKEIIAIIDEAETIARAKVRKLEEQEREKKEEDLKEVWTLRFRPYKEDLAFLTFEDFLRPQHLNKTETIKKVEEQMAQWLEARRNDIRVISTMPDSLEIMTEYKSCIDLALSINTVQERKRRAEEISKVIPKEKKEPITIFIIENAKDAKLTEMLLNENNITYKKEIN